jgi:hypothetical protein
MRCRSLRFARTFVRPVAGNTRRLCGVCSRIRWAPKGPVRRGLLAIRPCRTKACATSATNSKTASISSRLAGVTSVRPQRKAGLRRVEFRKWGHGRVVARHGEFAELFQRAQERKRFVSGPVELPCRREADLPSGCGRFVRRPGRTCSIPPSAKRRSVQRKARSGRIRTVHRFASAAVEGVEFGKELTHAAGIGRKGRRARRRPGRTACHRRAARTCMTSSATSILPLRISSRTVSKRCANVTRSSRPKAPAPPLIE